VEDDRAYVEEKKKAYRVLVEKPRGKRIRKI
jgi:hypothetical protein